MNKFIAHFQEYVGRYAVIAAPFLTGLAALLGTAAADLGGVDTSVGRAVTGVATAVGSAATIAVWLRNLGTWQVAELEDAVTKVEMADAEIRTGSNVQPDVPPGEPGGAPPRIG